MNDFLSKENTTNLYKQLIISNELNNLSKEQKDKIIGQLIDVMKRIYKTLDLSKINKTNLLGVKKQYNDIVVKQTSELIKNLFNKQTVDLNERKNEREFNSIKRPLPVPGNDRPLMGGNVASNTIAGNSFGLAPSSSSTADYMKRATEDISTRLTELEQSRRIGNEKKPPPEMPDYLKPIKVGKSLSDIPSIPSSSSSHNSKPLLGFSNNDDSNFSSSVPANDLSKYTESVSIQDRLKQLESERGMPVTSQPPSSNTNINALFSQPLHQSQSPPPSNQYNPQPPQTQYNPQPPQNQQVNDLIQKINEMQQFITNLKQENEYLKSQASQKKQSTKSFQLEVNKKDAVYNFQFNPVNNIKSIKLASYNLPQPLYNIIEDSRFIYRLNDNEKTLFVSKGFYNIDTLLNVLNNNDDLIFTVDTSQKINIKPKNDNQIQLIPNKFINKLGFNTNSLVADKVYDLRTPSKLLLYIRNIYQDQPVGILNFNNTSICEIQFNQLTTLNGLMIEFYTEDNILYNFNDIMYNLSFVIEILP